MSSLYEAIGYPTTHYNARLTMRVSFRERQRLLDWCAAYLAVPGRKVVAWVRCRHTKPQRAKFALGVWTAPAEVPVR